jgi:hypothetical protein
MFEDLKGRKHLDMYGLDPINLVINFGRGLWDTRYLESKYIET